MAINRLTFKAKEIYGLMASGKSVQEIQELYKDESPAMQNLVTEIAVDADYSINQNDDYNVNGDSYGEALGRLDAYKPARAALKEIKARIEADPQLSKIYNRMSKEERETFTTDIATKQVLPQMLAGRDFVGYKMTTMEQAKLAEATGLAVDDLKDLEKLSKAYLSDNVGDKITTIDTIRRMDGGDRVADYLISKDTPEERSVSELKKITDLIQNGKLQVTLK